MGGTKGTSEIKSTEKQGKKAAGEMFSSRFPKGPTRPPRDGINGHLC